MNTDAVNQSDYDILFKLWAHPNQKDKTIVACHTLILNKLSAQTDTEIANRIALCQRDPRWAAHNLGEEPGGPTIGKSGCLVTCLAMILRWLYCTDVTPDKLNDALARAETPFVDDDILVWRALPPLFRKFTDSLFVNRSHSAAELEALQADGWAVVLRQGNSSHFMYLSHVESGQLGVIDPWYGKLRRMNPGSFTGIRALRWGDEKPEPPPPPKPEPPLPPLSGKIFTLHVQEWRDGIAEYLARATPNAIKIFHPQHAARCHASSPNTLVVLRLYRSEQNLAPGQAMRYVEEMRHDLEQARPHIWGVESFNETIPSGNANLIRKAVAFDCEFSDALMALGEPVKPVLLNVAVGNPGFGEVDLLLPAVEKVCRTGGAVGYHAYWAASRELDLFDDYWQHHAGRWQEWDKVFRAHGLYPRYILGEAGACAWDGDWRPGDGWRSQFCYDGDWDWYLTQLRKFEQKIAEWNAQHGNRCLGACLFTTGTPATGWESFQIQEWEMRAL